jgi:GDPmannose 4,6-dehydratase
MHASNGILFNHESPIRGETFVTRKITRAVARIALGFEKVLYLGNLHSRRDWGHARDYVQAMYLMLQQEAADDYVIATGRQHSVHEFVTRAFAEVGATIEFSGAGIDEVAQVAAIDADLLRAACGDRNGAGQPGATAALALEPGAIVVRVDQRYYRPTEVETLLGDASKARERLGWESTVPFADLVHEMVHEDLQQARRDAVLRAEGYVVRERRE